VEALFVAPLHYGFVFFGWMARGLCGLLCQIIEEIGNIAGPAAASFATRIATLRLYVQLAFLQ